MLGIQAKGRLTFLSLPTLATYLLTLPFDAQ